jgi:glycosyltransferase involved in cell wall biosynthesis
MRIAFFWTGVTAYMAASWRALAAVPGVKLTVFIELPKRPDTAFDHESLLAGLDARVSVAGEPCDRAALERAILDVAPEAMVVLGWRSPLCRLAAESPPLAGVPKVFAIDMPFVMSLRKLVAPFVLRRYLARFALAYVPGERAAAYARHLGFPAGRIERGLIGFDTAAFAVAASERTARGSWPRRFLYVGRYAAEKRIDLLVEAYGRYRGLVDDPWTLTTCGMGPEAGRLRGVEGITDRGFVQPSAMPALMADHGAFVLASDYDPWPFVVSESVAAGLPVVCTDACGSHVELVRSWFNGRVVGPGDPAAFAEALQWIHAHEADLPAFSARGLPLAAPYAADVWADRTLSVCRRAAPRHCFD